MNIREYQNLCLSQAQKIVVQSVLMEAQKCNSTRKACKTSRQFIASKGRDFFCLADRELIDLGLEPNWSEADIEWDLLFVGLKGKFPLKEKVFAFVLSLLGLDRSIVGYIYGIDIPKEMDKESESKLVIAIKTAVILQALEEQD